MTRSLLFASLTLLVARPAIAQAPAPTGARRWTLEFFSGNGWNAPSPLTIEQTGQPDINFIAHWTTRPFYNAKYYAVRVTRWKGDKGWALDYTHHKLYLQNTTAEVQHFVISHGYNLLHLSKVWRTHEWILSAGGGVVFTHPENTVRGLVLDPVSGGTLGGGYYLDGVSVMGAVGRQVKIRGPLFTSGLLKVTLSDVTTRVRDGEAEVPNAAFHVNIGLGMRL